MRISSVEGSVERWNETLERRIGTPGTGRGRERGDGGGGSRISRDPGGKLESVISWRNWGEI